MLANSSSEWISSGSDDLVDSDVVVVETSEEEVSALVPGQAGATNGGLLLLSGGIDGGGLDVNDELLWRKIPNLDAVLGSQNQPVLLGGEENAVDGAVNFSLSEELALNEVPDDSETVFASWSQVRSLGGHVEWVDLRFVANEGVLEGHSLVVPHLDGLVPWSADNDGVLGILVEFNAGNPVSVSILLNSEFALSNGVPDLEVLISSTTGNLSVIGGEGNGKNVSCVANESLNGLSLFQVPESQGSVPWTSQAISAILWEAQITDKVWVT